MISELKAATPVDSKLSMYEAEAKAVAEHIAKFDTLDYVVFTQQQWKRLHESHSKDVIVHWPDGHQTEGIEKHIEDLKGMFVYAPDTRIKVHTVKFGWESGRLLLESWKGLSPGQCPPLMARRSSRPESRSTSRCAP